MKRSGPIARRTPLRARSQRTIDVAAERRAVVRDALARDRGCVARVLVPTVRCGGPLDGHERLPRSRGGSILDLSNVITVCRFHHGWIHDHPKEAKSLDLLA